MRRHGGRGTKHRVQALTHVGHAGAVAHRRQRIRVTGILNRNRQPIAPPIHIDGDGTAVEHFGDPVGDGILHERLKEQRRHAGRQRRLIDVARHLQSIAEADLLDGEESIGQRELIAERNPRQRAGVQRTAKEFRQQHTHSSRAAGVGAGERRNRIQTVVQEMRIELCPERAQFRIPRVRLQFVLPLFGFARLFECQAKVGDGKRQKKQQHGRGEQDRNLLSRAAISAKPGIESKTAIQAYARPSQRPPAITEEVAHAMRTRTRPLDLSGTARQTYQADKQTNE